MQIVFDNGTHVIRVPDSAEFNKQTDNRTVVQINDSVIKINNQVAQPVFGNYYCNKSDIIEMSGEVTLNGVLQTTVGFPVTLKMPIVRHANGSPTTDEEYFEAQIVDGIITINGAVDRSGDWKVLIERVNQALLRVGASFKFDSEDITFLV